MPNSVKGVEFWGILLQTIGLVVILANDVSYLRLLFRKLPFVRRTDQILQRLKTQCARFHPGGAVYGPRALGNLTGSETRSLLRLFPDWQPGKKMPEQIELTALVGTQARIADLCTDPLIEPALSSQNPERAEVLCNPIPLSLLSQRAEMIIQRRLYSYGFAFMLAGSFLLLYAAIQ